MTLLLECHERIRTHCAIAQALARLTPGAPLRLYSFDVGRLVRYFGVALPLHAADEDESLLPRLLAATESTAVLEALATLSSQHVHIEALLGQLLPVWERLLESPAADAAQLDALEPATSELIELMRAHLTLEERVIFPAAGRELSPGDWEGFQRELRARRGASDLGRAEERSPDGENSADDQRQRDHHAEQRQ